jgi:hypothetical protein
MKTFLKLRLMRQKNSNIQRNVFLCSALFREFQFPVEQVAETLRRAFVLSFNFFKNMAYLTTRPIDELYPP